MSAHLPRLTLSVKIILSFVIIIVFMLLGSFIILQQLKTLFSSNQNEFQSIQLIQSMEDSYNAERETVQNIFGKKDTERLQLFVMFSSQFQRNSDSLLHTTESTEERVLIQSIQRKHFEYEEFVRTQATLLMQDPAYDIAAMRRAETQLRDSLIQAIHSLDDDFIPSLSKALNNFQQQREFVQIIAYVIVVLSVCVAFAISLIVAKTLIKPIIALKAGTEKVGEGKYETVKVTTTDEVADLTRAFNIMSDKLRQLDEMRMQLMSEISHEMRTPLQVIKAGCYTIVHIKNGPSLTQQQRDAVAMISQATNRINAFVNSFLDVAKMEAGLMKFNFAPVDLKELLTPIVQEAQLIAQTRQIVLDFQADALSPVQIDKERMNQVFSNLLSNALKYTPDSGAIHVRLNKMTDCAGINKNGTGCVRVEVQDTGVGIPQADLAKLFDKFYQAANVPLVNEKGSGLGLALVKHVTEAHGGRVNVTSTVGMGSTFIVELPL
jgi:two-component system sensor histidine kinase GlrK